MKTALELLIENFHANINGLNLNISEMTSKREIRENVQCIKTLQKVAAELTQQLPTEREQIEAAFQSGMGHPDHDFFTHGKLEQIKSDYFHQTYKTNEQETERGANEPNKGNENRCV